MELICLLLKLLGDVLARMVITHKQEVAVASRQRALAVHRRSVLAACTHRSDHVEDLS